ncbi:MAG TPA: hypothetical protein VMB79_05640, partial [Jatrophihabitans sp.]|nr:hypothetical protein [Jatrophihabitans sp.]
MTTRLRWLDVPGDALAPRPFLARRPAGDVPGVLWSPVARAGGPSPGEPPPVVLLGHGGSGHKTTDRLCRLAGLLRRAGVAALAIDGPFHGDRAGPGDAGPGYQRRVIALGADPVMDSMVADWL